MAILLPAISGGVKMRSIALAALSVALTSCMGPYNVAPASATDSRSKSLWQSTGIITVGTIVQTDPAGWEGGKNLAQFRVLNSFLEGKIPSGVVHTGDETITLTKKGDVTAAASLIGSLTADASFKNAKTIELKTIGGTVTQYTTYDDLLKVLKKFDCSGNDVACIAQRGPDGQTLYARLNEDGDKSKQDWKKASYWMVTKIYKAERVSWKNNSNRTFEISGACPKSAEAVGTCSLKAAVEKGANNEASNAQAIVFVQVVPVLKNSSGVLYLPLDWGRPAVITG